MSDTRRWFSTNTIGPTCTVVAHMLSLKRAAGATVSVCLPARDEEATIGSICRAIKKELMLDYPLVDELIVVDSRSRDGTVAAAEAAGARVAAADDVDVGALPPSLPGKGEALWKSVAIATGDIIVWADADTRNFRSDFVTKLVAPLLADSALVMTKAFYERPDDAALTEPRPGGRITEIAARPLLALLHPDLTGFIQPLSGEFAMRRSAALRVPFASGYAVDAGLLIDVVRTFGLSSVAQVDLGRRLHRPRDLLALGRAATEVAQILLARAGVTSGLDGEEIRVVQFDQSAPWPQSIATSVHVLERPPMETLLQPSSATSASGTTDGSVLAEGRA